MILCILFLYFPFALIVLKPNLYDLFGKCPLLYLLYFVLKNIAINWTLCQNFIKKLNKLVQYGRNLIFVLHWKSLVGLYISFLCSSLVDKLFKYFEGPDDLVLFLCIKWMVYNDRNFFNFFKKLNLAICCYFVIKKHGKNIYALLR